MPKNPLLETRHLYTDILCSLNRCRPVMIEQQTSPFRLCVLETPPTSPRYPRVVGSRAHLSCIPSVPGRLGGIAYQKVQSRQRVEHTTWLA